MTQDAKTAADTAQQTPLGAAAAAGILPVQAIRALISGGALASGEPTEPGQLQPASVDLRLGPKAYRVRASFLPGPGGAVADRLDDLKLHEFDIEHGAVLETGCVYVVPLLESLKPKAVHDAGCWRLPDGEAYYAQVLYAQTTSKISPAEVHKLGRDVTAELSARADVLFKELGFTKGTVGERYIALYESKKGVYPNTDEGKAELKTLGAVSGQTAGVILRALVNLEGEGGDTFDVSNVKDAD